MSQPPKIDQVSGTGLQRPPQWRRPPGVAAGTWNYVNERSIADRYDQFVADTPLCRLDTEILHQEFPTIPAGTRGLVLDLGCGSGRTSMALAERGYDVVAIDLSTRMLQVTARKAAETSTAGSIHPLRANLVQLECLADHSADHAVCLFSTLGMIQGRDHRRAMLRHVARILRNPDSFAASETDHSKGSSGIKVGRFLLHVHNRWSALAEPAGFRRLTTSWWRSLREPESEFGDATYGYRGLDNMFMHRFSRREILSDLRQCGWQIESVCPISIDGTHVEQSFKIPGGYFIVGRVGSTTQ